MTERLLENKRILVAEDNEPSLELALILLRSAGADASGVSNGREAVELVKAECFDAVLMDVQMPLMDGKAATEAIRESESAEGTRIAIIGLTAHAMREQHEACIDAGMDAVITKPLDTATFAPTILQHLDAVATGD